MYVCVCVCEIERGFNYADYEGGEWEEQKRE